MLLIPFYPKGPYCWGMYRDQQLPRHPSVTASHILTSQVGSLTIGPSVKLVLHIQESYRHAMLHSRPSFCSFIQVMTRQ